MAPFRRLIAATIAFAMMQGTASAQQGTAASAPPSNTVTPLPHPFASPAFVTFTSTEPGALLQQWHDGDWLSLCVAPCKIMLDPRGTYQVDGPGFSTSPEFRVRPGASGIRTGPGSLALKGGGIALTAVAGVVTAVGLFVLALTLCKDKAGNGDDCGSQSDRALASEFLVPGVLGLAAGIYMIVGARTTIATDASPGIALGRGFRLGPGGLTF